MSMATHSSDPWLPRVSARLADQMGLHFLPERWRDLQRAIQAAAPELGFEDPQACLEWLATATVSRGHIEILAGHLTVGETYFFRDHGCFRILEEHILPELIRERRGRQQRLRIWSAGCCTGEE